MNLIFHRAFLVGFLLVTHIKDLGLIQDLVMKA